MVVSDKGKLTFALLDPVMAESGSFWLFYFGLKLSPETIE
jgi:hypothetical protein